MAQASCAQTRYQYSLSPDQDPESGVRVRPDLVRQWVALSDPEIRFKEEPPSRTGRGAARWDLWTPPPPRVSSTPAVHRSAPPRKARWLGWLASTWRKFPLACVVGACDVVALVIALVGTPVTLDAGPSDAVAVDSDIAWTEARTSAAIGVGLRATYRLAPADAPTIVAWADLPTVR
jgi:hypothetical protein